MQEAPHPITDLVETMEAANDGDIVRIADLVDSFGPSAHAPLLFVPAAMLVSPLSGVPFLSSLLGMTIALIAVQAALGRERIWLPATLRRRTLTKRRASQVAQAMRRLAAWLDAITRRRLHPLVGPGARPLVYLLCALAGMTLPLLELVPFSSSLIGGAIAVISVGLLVRDGLCVLLGGLFLVAAYALPLTLITRIV